jgi:hypothetical protein
LTAVRVFARLEHDRVPGDQGRHDVAVGQVAREVIRAEHREHAVRAVPQHGVAVRDLRRGFAGARAVGLHRNVDLGRHRRHFRARFPQGLADFLGDGGGQLLGVLLEQVAKALADGNALFQRAQRPFLEVRARRLHGARHVPGSRFVAGPGLAAGGGIDRGQQRTAAGEPFAVDVVRQVSHWCSSLR